MFKRLGGREMRITQYDRVQVKQTQANLFVKNLGNEATNQSLYLLFKTFGDIFSAKLAEDHTGKSKGYGYVQYTQPEQAQRALALLHGAPGPQKPLVVLPYKTHPRAHDPGFHNLYVKNLPTSITTKEALARLFEGFGEQLSVGLFQSERQGKVAYYGIVSLKSAEEAARAVRELHQKPIDGCPLYVAKALNKEQRERQKAQLRFETREQARRITLYVKSVTGDPLSEEFILQQLQEFAPLKRVSVPRQRSSEGVEVNLSIAFVIFETEEDLQRVTVCPTWIDPPPVPQEPKAPAHQPA